MAYKGFKPDVLSARDLPRRTRGPHMGASAKGIQRLYEGLAFRVSFGPRIAQDCLHALSNKNASSSSD